MSGKGGQDNSKQVNSAGGPRAERAYQRDLATAPPVPAVPGNVVATANAGTVAQGNRQPTGDRAALAAAGQAAQANRQPPQGDRAAMNAAAAAAQAKRK